MAWNVELSTRAQKDLDGLDLRIARSILAFLHIRIARLADPRSIGEALNGSGLGEFRKYRMGDQRIVCRIEDGATRILVVGIGNRRDAPEGDRPPTGKPAFS